MNVEQQLRAGLGDRYQIERQIGEGGMATVFLARDLKHDRPVAIKAFRPELAATMGADRFFHEIELSARLQHPHIVPLYDSGVAGGIFYFVMPFVEGESLRNRLDRDKQIPFDEAVELTREIASALAYAHGQGLVHRDIKPENILLTGGHAMLADFGIARAVGIAQQGKRHTGLGFAVGTPGYMSPEQATASELDARTDQYSLAAVFYEMVSGEVPFSGPTVQAALAQSLTGPRPKLTKLVRTVPPDADPVVARALASDPAERYPTIMAFAEDLVRSGGGGQAVLTKQRRLLGAVAFFSAAFVISLLALVFWPREPIALVRKEAEVIAVAPFTTSGPGVETLGEGMVDLLSANLNTVGGIRVVEPRLVLAQWRRRGNPADPDAGRSLARAVNANSVLTGSLVSTGNRVRIAAALHGLDGTELAKAQVDGASDSVLVLVDRLSADLVRGIWQSNEPVPSLRVSGITTNSMEAMRSFLDGERLYRRSAWDSAQLAFQRAVELDSTFSLAYLRLSSSIGWVGGYGSSKAVEASDAARRFADRLPPRERSLVATYSLFSRGNRAAGDSARRYVAQYPDDVEGWFVLGEAYYHNRAVDPRPPEEIRAPFDRVIALDSSLTPAALHPAEMAIAYRDSALLDRYIEVMRRAGSEDEARAYRTAADIGWGRRGLDSTAIALIGSRRGAYQAAIHAAELAPDGDAERVWALVQHAFSGSGGSPAEQTLARSVMAAGLGRFEQARAIADSLQGISQDLRLSALLHPITLGIAPPGYGGDVASRVLAANRVNPFQVHAVIQVALVRGDLSLAGRLADSLLARDTVAVAGPVRSLVTAAKGRVLLARGDTLGGIRLLSSALESASGTIPPFLSVAARLELATVLAMRPATRELGLLRLRYGFDSDFGVMSVTQLLLGRALEAAGQREDAVASYSRFLRLWSADDAWAAEARAAIGRLTGEAASLR